MRSFPSILIAGLIALFALSCKNGPSDLALLNRCESIAYSQPERAISILDSIQFPEDFGKDARYRYLLQLTQLRHQTSRNVTEDLQLQEATSYYTKKEIWDYVALSEYCLGVILMEKDSLDMAGAKLYSALRFVEISENDALKGMVLLEIGQLQLQQSKWPQADASLQKAIMYFERTADREHSAEALSSLAEIHEQIGNFDQAKRYRLNALNQCTKPELTAKCYLELSQLSYIQNQKDSVNKYAELLQQSMSIVSNPAIRSNSWQFLIEWYQESGRTQDLNTAKAAFNDVFTDLVLGNEAKSLLSETSKLDQVRKLYNARLQSGRIWMNGVIILSMLIILIILIRNRSHRKALLEAESRIDTLQNLANEFERKEDSLRQLALRHFDILKKVALLDGMMKEQKSGQEKKMLTLFNQAVYENNSGFDWDTFFKSLNLLKNGIPQKVRQQYPTLTETEYRILILSFTGLSNKETSIILNLSTNTINSHRSSIRRKLNMPEYGDLEEFVTNQILNKQA